MQRTGRRWLAAPLVLLALFATLALAQPPTPRPVTEQEFAQGVGLRAMMRQARVNELANRQNPGGPDPNLSTAYGSIYEEARLAHLMGLPQITLYADPWARLMQIGDNPKAPAQVSVIITGPEPKPKVGDELDFTVTVKDEDGLPVTGEAGGFHLQTSNGAVLLLMSVSPTGGRVKCVGAGEADIVATATNGKKGTKYLTVQ